MNCTEFNERQWLKELHGSYCVLQLAGGVILGVALWLRHDPQTSNLLEIEFDGAQAPSTFYISTYLIYTIFTVCLCACLCCGKSVGVLREPCDKKSFFCHTQPRSWENRIADILCSFALFPHKHCTLYTQPQNPVQCSYQAVYTTGSNIWSGFQTKGWHKINPGT